MDALSKLPLLGRFKKILRGIGGAVCNRARWQSSPGPVLAVGLVELTIGKLRRYEQRFVRLVERYDAGKLRPLPPPGQAPEREATEEKPAGRKPTPPKPKPEDFGVEQKFGWVTGLGLHPGASWMGTFEDLVLRDVELQAKIAAEPRRFGRILRPLCFMLGVKEMPDVLRRPGEKNAEATYDDWVVDKIIAQQKALRAAGQKLWHELLNEIEPRDPTLPIKLPPQFRFFRTPFGRLLQLE